MINSMAADGLEDAQPVRAVVRRGGIFLRAALGAWRESPLKWGRT